MSLDPTKFTIESHTPPIWEQEEDFSQVMSDQLKHAPWLAISILAHAVVLVMLWVMLDSVKPLKVEKIVQMEDVKQEEEIEEETEHKGFTYVWEQMPMDALSHEGIRYIHFRFPDGTEMKKAFTYDWRMWTLPELREILTEAGFSQVDVYWEGATEDGEGNGVFKKITKAPQEQSWIAYVVAWR